MKTPWYKRLLCGFNWIGDFAEFVNKGTDINVNLTPNDRTKGFITTKCWCCTFWRGIVLGLIVGFLSGFIV